MKMTEPVCYKTILILNGFFVKGALKGNVNILVSNKGNIKIQTFILRISFHLQQLLLITFKWYTCTNIAVFTSLGTKQLYENL